MTLFIGTSAYAGDFEIVHMDDEWVSVDYTGVIDFSDERKFRTIMETFPDHKVMLFIDSGGGYAYAGVDLYWAAREYKHRLHTVAGYKFGAWSAAALFWAGGNQHIAEGGIVGFHLAYCNGWNPPGCDTSDIDAEFMVILEEEFGCDLAWSMRDALEWSRGMFGISGWVAFMTSGVYMIDTSGDYMEPYLF